MRKARLSKYPGLEFKQNLHDAEFSPGCPGCLSHVSFYLKATDTLLVLCMDKKMVKIITVTK